jgi:hypothetical protein
MVSSSAEQLPWPFGPFLYLCLLRGFFKGFVCTGKSGPGLLAELRKRTEPDVQLPGHGDAPSPVDPSLAKNATCDAMFEPFECCSSSALGASRRAKQNSSALWRR